MSSSILPGFEYDIFISYRQKDNNYDGWVTEFVNNLSRELESTFKEDVSVYFDINPHDGLLDTHDVDASLKEKLKCLIFIPIISRTYCDPNSFAWEHEFKAFIEQASQDRFGLKIKLPNGNVANRILPLRIHDLDAEDKAMIEIELKGPLRAIDFIYKEPGVNKPITPADDEKKNLNNTKYRIQINKVANAIGEIIHSLKKVSPAQVEEKIHQQGPLVVENKDYDGKRLIAKAATSQKLKKWFIILIVMILCIVGAFVVFKIIPGGRQTEDLTKLEKSIAVLPFVDLSPEHDKEYFSDGMVDEILNNLCMIGDLKVTSRTSSMQYKGETKKSVKEIARELGVANILEGSVRLYKNNVRITVQLIKAETDEHLWVENYDRDFSDIISIQSEVAQKVAKALKAEISPEAQRIIDLKLTTNPQAYNLYMQARFSYKNFNNNKSILLLKKAIELDPDFCSAYARLGFLLSPGGTYISTSAVLNTREVWENAKPYFEKAIVLNPDNGIAHNLFAWSVLWYEWDFKTADKEYRETKRIFPNYSWTDYLVAMGQFEEAYDGAFKNATFDSKNWQTWVGIITSSYFANREPGSEIRKALSIPTIRDDINVRSEAARIYMYMNEYDKAISIAKQLLQDFPNVESPRLQAIQAISYFNTNRPDESNRIIAELKQRSEVNVVGSPSFCLAMIYSQMLEINDAFKWLEKAFHNHEVEMYWLKVEPAFKPLHSDPRFLVLLDKIGFP